MNVVDCNDFMHNHVYNPSDNPNKFTIKQILEDNWDNFCIYAKAHNVNVRPIVFHEIERMLSCKTIDLGYSFFECPMCNDFYISFHTCKSRSCTSCGIKYAKDRTISMHSIAFNCKHRHMVFTIPKELRTFFREDRYRLNILFEAVSSTIWIG